MPCRAPIPWKLLLVGFLAGAFCMYAVVPAYMQDDATVAAMSARGQLTLEQAVLAAQATQRRTRELGHAHGNRHHLAEDDAASASP